MIKIMYEVANLFLFQSCSYFRMNIVSFFAPSCPAKPPLLNRLTEFRILLRCHKILGPPCDWGPPAPILPVGWGPRRELGAPHTFLTASSVRLRDGRSVSVCQCLSVSSAIKQVPNMPNHQCIMETEKESRFTNCDIFA